MRRARGASRWSGRGSACRESYTGTGAPPSGLRRREQLLGLAVDLDGERVDPTEDPRRKARIVSQELAWLRASGHQLIGPRADHDEHLAAFDLLDLHEQGHLHVAAARVDEVAVAAVVVRRDPATV